MNNDFISREAVIDRYYAEWEKQDICDGSEDRNWLMQCIDEAPVVDAVEVVRCIKCENFEPNEIIAPQTGTCWHCEMVKSFDSFCSDGKPKDGE